MRPGIPIRGAVFCLAERGGMSEEVPIDRAAWIDIANRFRRAALRGGRLQLEHRHVIALLNANFYPWLAALEVKAMAPCAGSARSSEPQEGAASKIVADRSASQPLTQETSSSGRCGMAEAARLTGMKQRTLLYYVHDIPGTSKPAGRWIFDVEQLKAWSSRISRAKRPTDRGRLGRADDVEAAYERALGSDRRRE